MLYITLLKYMPLLISFSYYIIRPQMVNNEKRALPDSNWDHPNWQLGTLPVKLRALKPRAGWFEHPQRILEIPILTIILRS